MIRKRQDHITIYLQRSAKYLHYTVKGIAQRPLRFELIDLDGKKVNTTDLFLGDEFVVPTQHLPEGEYLYAVSHSENLLHTGVVTL